MSDKPTDLPAWATTGTKTEPSSGSKLAGWIPGAKAAAQHFNWLLFTIYSWVLWLNVGILQRSAAADNSPLLSSADRDGNVRHYIDPNGYFGGPAINETHRWGPLSLSVITTGATCSRAGAAVIVDTNTYVKAVGGETTANVGGGPQLQLEVTTSASAQRALVLQEYGGGTPAGDQPISDLDDNVVVMEWGAYLSSATLTGMEYAGGLHNFASITNAGLGAATNRFVQFYASPGNANWLCRAAAGGSVTTVASTVPADTTRHNFRIELHGASTALGASIARFFIDGVLITEMSTDDSDQVPSGGSSLGMMFWAGGSSPASNRSLFVTTTKVAWTEARTFVAPI